MSAPSWFPVLTDTAPTWALILTDNNTATIDGTAELPPMALLAQGTFTFTASADLTVRRLLAGVGTFGFTATASLRVVEALPPPPTGETEVLPPVRALNPSSADWRLVTDSTLYISPITGKSQSVSRGGERWAVTLNYTNLRGGEEAQLRAMLAALRGPLNRVMLPDHAYARRGALTADLQVFGAGQTGDTLTCFNGGSNVTNAVREGDLFTLDERLYMVTEDANTDGDGHLTLSITPPILEPPASGAVVWILAPTAKFMLAGNSVSWSYTPGRFTSFNAIELVEDRS